MINRWEMQCQSLGPGEEGQMHSNNATQTRTHSRRVHTMRAHTNPPSPLATLCALWYYTHGKGSDLGTTQRHRHISKLRGSKQGFFLMLNIHMTHTLSYWLPTSKLTTEITTTTVADAALMSLKRLWMCPWLTAGFSYLQKHNSRTGTRTSYFNTVCRDLHHVLCSARLGCFQGHSFIHLPGNHTKPCCFWIIPANVFPFHSIWVMTDNQTQLWQRYYHMLM